jgi:hypothetical protein
MLKVRICTTAGAAIAEGIYADSGFFPPALASIYNAALDLTPGRSLESFGSSTASADYPVGTQRARFGYRLPRDRGGGYILDDEVVVHIERT